MARSSLQRAVEWRPARRPAGGLARLPRGGEAGFASTAPAALVAPAHGPAPLAAARRVDEAATSLARALGRVVRVRAVRVVARARARRTSRVVRAAARASADDSDGPAPRAPRGRR